jgi:transcriptional regulator with XRE-family HTH domain
MGFGEKLKGLRLALGKSQAEVAREIAEMFEEIRISQTSLSALEQRDTAPRQEVLEVLAQYYSVPITYFFDSTPPDRINRALEYLEALKRKSFPSGMFAHSTDPRNIEENINNLNDYSSKQKEEDQDDFLGA